MIPKRSKILLAASGFCMLSFFMVKSSVIFNIFEDSYTINLIEYLCFIFFCPPFFLFIKDFIKQKNLENKTAVDQLTYKNTYLEHAAKILRHDMHSGINVYMPRGLTSLERRLPQNIIEEYKLQVPLKLIKEGLIHTQKVYKGVYEFTNLVKQGKALELTNHNLKEILSEYLDSTAYKSQVIIDQLISVPVNPPLFCTAIDNLIRNGLRYNDSENKIVVIFMEDDNTLVIQDNGRGMTSDEFEYLSKTNKRRENQKETGSGLGLGICVGILKEHNFSIRCEKVEEGTQLKIKLR